MKLAKMIVGLLALAVVCFAAAYAAAEPQAQAAGSVVRKIVVFSNQTSDAERQALAASAGKIIRTLDLIHAVVIETPAAQVTANEARLRSSRGVVRVDEDPKINWLLGAATPARVVDVPMPSLGEIMTAARAAAEPTQETPWGIKRVNAQAAWGAARLGEGVKVAVIDTGIDRTHPDLVDNIKGGWNAIDKSDNFNDDNGHGTHCSGTIAATDNGEGVVGVAPKASLYGVKVLDAGGSGSFSDVIAGMQWAVDNKMHVASMSLGASRGNESLRQAVEAMAKSGVVLVAAAGNSGGSVGFPAAYPGAIAIAAMDKTDKVASFSSRGPSVALIAPGVDVNSTYMGGTYDSLSGTSMATPHVSGLAALAIAARGLSAESVRSVLTGAAVPLKDVPVEQQGAGVIDAAKLAR